MLIAEEFIAAGAVGAGVDHRVGAVGREAFEATIERHPIFGIGAHDRGLDQQRLFREEGVDLSRVVIGHSGDTTDLAYLEEIMRRGSFIGMDRFGIDPILSFDDRVATVATLCERGHADQMVLSHDAACFIDLSPNIRAHLPNSHYLHITRDVIPALEKHGVSQDQIDQMLITNPRRIFEHPGGAY